MAGTTDPVGRIHTFFRKRKGALGKTFVVLFAVFYLTFLTAALTAGACRSERSDPSKRVIYCNISLAAGVWADMLPSEVRKRSMVRLHRGIALLQADRPEDARADFIEAIKVIVRDPNASYPRDSHMRVIKFHSDPRVEPFWRETLDQMIARAEAAS